MLKKILIYGENWVGTLPQLLYTDIKQRNIDVDIFDFTDVLPGIKHRTLLQKIKRRLFEFYYKKKINDKFLKKLNSFMPDVVIIVKGLHLTSDTLKQIKNKKIFLINWNPDDYFNMKNSNLDLIANMVFYDMIVSSRKHLFQKYYDYGAKNILF